MICFEEEDRKITCQLGDSYFFPNPLLDLDFLPPKPLLAEFASASEVLKTKMSKIQLFDYKSIVLSVNVNNEQVTL